MPNFVSWLLLVALLLTACAPSSSVPPPTPSPPSKNAVPPQVVFRIASGTHAGFLSERIKEFNQQPAQQSRRQVVTLTQFGAVVMKEQLEKNTASFDGVFAEDSIWIGWGDVNRTTTNQQIIMQSPVVLGVRMSKASELGWIGQDNISIGEILSVVNAGKLKYAMPSGSQSTPGAVAYLGFLSALRGGNGTLTQKDLGNPQLQGEIKSLLRAVNRGSSEPADLANSFVKDPGISDAMFNTEALILQANRRLVEKGEQPLYIVYPANGLATIAPVVAYIDHGDEAKRDLFLRFRDFLLSDDVQQNTIRANGWRIGENRIGMGYGPGDRTAISAIFNPEWGVTEKPSSRGFVYPEVEVIDQALTLYQGEFRPGSVTQLVIDKSGSMDGGSGQKDASGRDLGIKRIKAAQNASARLLDPDKAEAAKLQASVGDTFQVFPFAGGVVSGWKREIWTVHGNNPEDLRRLNGLVQSLVADGLTTDMYSALLTAIPEMDAIGIGDRLPAIILLTDGISGNKGAFADVEKLLTKRKEEGKPPIRIHAIAIGEADRDQLEKITSLTGGRYVDARTEDLEAVFRSIRGEN